VSSPKYSEICTIINKLKSNKAAGSDSIPPELIKNGRWTLKQKLCKLVLKIWDEEELPAQWNERIVCPIYRKGGRLKCNMYRQITLLNIAFKIFAMLLNKRLSDSWKNWKSVKWDFA
jgi:hypothetical protein